MRNVFICNNENTKTLQERLHEIIPSAQSLDILVGFFYFSGIKALYEPLLKNPDINMRVLVGLNIDKTAREIVEVDYDLRTNSDETMPGRYLNDVLISLNSDRFDNPIFAEQIKFFVQMLKDDRLIIRKTRKPNHAKLYNFSYAEPAHRPGFITGSSNLTASGLYAQPEFNVELGDHGVGEIASEFFQDLWDDAIFITEHADIKTKLIQIIENQTHTREISPFEAYALTLKSYLDVSSPKGHLKGSTLRLFEDNNYEQYAYQLDAIKQALNIIDQYNGVIIADVVGLGKSVIAGAVARELGKRGMILCPPGLIGQRAPLSGWEMYKSHFQLHNWDIESTGQLERVAQIVNKEQEEYEVIIVDEAHRFRNTDTQNYEHLTNICRGRKVMLLTATPFNNNPSDIISLLRLFITPKKSSITLDNDLKARFREYERLFNDLSFINRYHNDPDPQKRKKALELYIKIFNEDIIDLSKVKNLSHSLAKEIREVITPVTIRRNRLDLKNNPTYSKEVSTLSRLEDPVQWYYELNKEQSAFYDRVIYVYFQPSDELNDNRKVKPYFTGAIYQPLRYKLQNDILSEDENFHYQSQGQLASFMRRLMVKRFESSFGSFRQTIINMKAITEKVLWFVEKTGKHVLDRKFIDKIYDLDDDQIIRALNDYAEELEESTKDKKISVYDISEFNNAAGFLGDIKSDIALFDKILRELDQTNLFEEDPKTNTLIKQIRTELKKPSNPGEPKRKIIIFTEYADTVAHLEKPLTDHFGERLLVVKGDLSDSKIQAINQNFDASNNAPLDDYDILLSTDRISEGFNLNRAGMIINYDIPWNPVRVIQRVGRINRISRKVFDSLYIINFFPTEAGNDIVRIREIAENKMFAIHTILGEDSKIFNVDEEPSPSKLFTRLTTNVEELEEMSFYTKMVLEWQKIENAHPELSQTLQTFPKKVKVSKAAKNDELLVFFKKGGFFIQRLADDKTEPESISYEEAFPDIVCDFPEKRLPFSNTFWHRYQIAKEIPPDKIGGLSGPASVESDAYNMLHTLLSMSEFSMYHDFISDLILDIESYGTLPGATLRKIKNLNLSTPRHIQESLNTIQDLALSMGRDFLNIQKANLKIHEPELIIAIENQRIQNGPNA